MTGSSSPISSPSTIPCNSLNSGLDLGTVAAVARFDMRLAGAGVT